MPPDRAGLLCHCGAPVPPDFPEPGGSPLPCASCGTPLVAPGRVDRERIERALGAALLTGVACAALWMLLARQSATGAPIVVVFGGALVGLAARAAARARGLPVQLAAVVSFVVFFVLGEILLYRAALLPRLVAMHAREGAENPGTLAKRELDRLRELPERIEHYVHIESTLALFVALAVGTAVLLLITRAPRALTAFRQPRPVASPEAAAPEAAAPEADTETVADTDAA